VERDPHPSVLPEVSVVIPTLGRPVLARALQALEAGSCRPARVLVVDQSEGEHTVGLVEKARDRGLLVERVPCRGTGRAVGVNEGIRRVRTPFLLVTDDDCIPEPQWVEAMARALREYPEAIVTGRIEAWEGGDVPVVVTASKSSVQRRPRLTFDLLSGGNMGAAVEVVESLGLLDEDPRTATAEDAELAYRALRAGVPLVYEPASGVAHTDWRKREERVEQYRSYALSHGAFYGKYLRRGDALIGARLVVHLIRATRRWGAGVLLGDDDRALNGRSYLLHLPRGVVSGWRSDGGTVAPSGGDFP
jgi:GT2 family glycosyltransferase